MATYMDAPGRGPARALRWAVAAIAGGVVAVSAVLAALHRPSAELPPTRPLAVTHRPLGGATGRITYEVSGAGYFAVDAAGGPAETASPPWAKQAPAGRSESETFPAPDRSRVARVERTEAGVFLNILDGDRALLAAQLAGPESAPLVDGGKVAARAVAGVPLAAAWSPDARTLAYGSLTGEPFTLHVADFGAALALNLRDYPVAGGFVGELAWSPNGRYLAISTYALDRSSHTVLMFDAITGGLQRLSDGCHIVWSPDSQYIAIHRDPQAEPGAWVLSVDGHERWELSSDPKAFPYTWTGG